MHGYALFPCIQVIPWFHSVKFKEGRTSRQTELQCEFPLHVVCSWSGNSPRIAQQRNLVVTEDDFATAAGDLLNLCNENADHPLIVTNFFNFKSHLTRRLDPTSFATHNSGGNYFSEICSRISDSASDHQPRGRDTYLFIRLLLSNPANPSSVPITIELGSGTALVVSYNALMSDWFNA